MKEIHVCFASDNWYAPHLCVAIYSLLKNLNKEYCSNIYILDGGIKSDNKEKIVNSCDYFYNHKIIFIKVDGTKFSKINATYLTKEAFYRLESPTIFNNLNEIIYLDCDIIVNGDISQILKENTVKNYYIKAVSEITMNNYYMENLKIDKNLQFFNTWVLLINLDNVRAQNLFEKVYNYLIENSQILLAWDQDWLNAIFNRIYTVLPPKFNALPFIFLTNNYKNLWYKKDEFFEAKNNPVVIHYAWAKPWRYFCDHPLRSKYREYRNETLFADFKCTPIDTFSFKWLLNYIINKIYIFLICNLREKQYYFFVFLPKKYIMRLLTKCIW